MSIILDGSSGITTPGEFNSSNLTFIGTGQRIIGDFSNATVANRLAFQTSTINNQTTVSIIPNGTSTTSQLQLNNASDPTNGSTAGIQLTSTVALFYAGVQGTGTYLPLTLYTSSFERMRIDTSGNVGVGTQTMNGKFNAIPKGTFDPTSATWAEAALSTQSSFGGGLSMIDGSAGHVLHEQSSGAELVLRQGTVGSVPTEKLRVTNTVLSLTGLQGIQFQAAQSASSNANTLDDYEEGTWTPTMGFSSGSVTYTTRTGVYTKVGNLVTVQFEIVVNVASSPSGQFTITGLPFAPSAVNLGGVSSCRLGSGGAGAYYYIAGEIGSAPRIYFAASTTNITNQVDCANMIGNGFYIKCGASYLTA